MIGEGAGRVTQARRFHSKLPLTLEDLDGTRKGVEAKPHGIAKLYLDLATRGPSNWEPKDKNGCFGCFRGILRLLGPQTDV